MWENIVAKVVEPPVLMSRTLTFVLATAIVMLAVLVFTLMKMAPLTRPEVFFLRYQGRRVNYVLEQPDPQDADFQQEYIEGFVRTYVIARNTLEKQTRVTIDMWNNIVKPWSSPQVYDAFRKTNLYNDVMFHRLHNISCVVDFEKITNTNNVYHVVFNRICYNQNSGRQTEQKSYKIDIEIQSYLDNQSGIVSDNLEELRNNPLGIQVTDYKVIGKNNNKGIDPLSDLEPDFYKEGTRQ